MEYFQDEKNLKINKELLLKESLMLVFKNKFYFSKLSDLRKKKSFLQRNTIFFLSFFNAHYNYNLDF